MEKQDISTQTLKDRKREQRELPNLSQFWGILQKDKGKDHTYH